MVLTTFSVAVNLTPKFLSTFFKHYLISSKQKQERLKNSPSQVQLSYDLGLNMVKSFLIYATSNHTLTELQHFANNSVPTPNWISKESVTIDNNTIEDAAKILTNHLEIDDKGLEKVGGRNWWKYRGKELDGEWIEMKKDKIKRGDKEMDKVILYIHGGAYHFSSIETHRYQIQRHARKLGARAFAPAYRLAPQYPFPSILHDILAAYLYLINPPTTATHSPISPSKIVFYGDSSGAASLISLLVILRDQKIPLPSSAVLISPWVDLTHSFPSVNTDGKGDYIPSEGFSFKPGIVWPPLKGDGIEVVIEEGGEKVLLDEQIQAYCSNQLIDHPLVSPIQQGSLGGLPPLMILGGSSELLSDEIIYLAHKIASPTLYPPSTKTMENYPAQKRLFESTSNLPNTLVHLSIYDSTCHVLPTLSITRPAKFMYRGAASFALWALELSKKKLEREQLEQFDSLPPIPPTENSTTIENIDINLGSNTINKLSSNSNSLESTPKLPFSPNFLSPHDLTAANNEKHSLNSQSSSISNLPADVDHTNLVTVTGHEIFPLRNHHSTTEDPSHPTLPNMIRERVSVLGEIRIMESPLEIPALNIPPDEICTIRKGGPILKWLKRREFMNEKFSKELNLWRSIKEKDRELAEREGWPLLANIYAAEIKGGEEVGRERPPLSSLAGYGSKELAKKAGEAVDGGKKSSMGIRMWANISAKPDEAMRNLEREMRERV